MRAYEFWREHGGGVWAIELEQGVVVGCCGPLDASEIDERFLDGFEYDPAVAPWVEAHRDRFELFRPTAPYELSRRDSRS